MANILLIEEFLIEGYILFVIGSRPHAHSPNPLLH
jgi:hypothetical protein